MGELQTVVIGIDGAHFELIEDWIERGELPNIRHAIESGVTGDLESVLPPVTSPNWKAYATGKNPAKFGIFWWENIDTKEGRVYYPSHRKNVEREYWEILAERNPVGVVGVPTTYPPKTVDGFVVSGAPDGEDEGFTHPPELEEQLHRELGYRIQKQYRLKDDIDRAAEEILDLIDSRFRAARNLTDEHEIEFLQATTFYINSLHHYLWDHEYTLEGWKIIDEHLGAFLNKDCDVVLMSDHGSTKIETAFSVNTWFEREGYLSLDSGVSNILFSLGINTDRLVRLATALRVQRIARRIVPDRIVNAVPDEEGEIKREGKTDTVDWKNTDAIASGQGLIYLTMERDDPRYERVREEMIEKITKLPETDGLQIAQDVYCCEEVYDGRFVSEAPDIVIDQAPGVHLLGGIGRNDIVVDPSDEGWRAENKRHGLFAACGPSFTSGRIEEISILDLAPTILHKHGHSIPDDMDGMVRKSVFASDAKPGKRDISFQSTSQKATEIERIRQVTRRVDL